MLTIDGARLEGGGQIIRMAVALSSLTGTPVQIVRIRAKRDNPGLAAQHISAIRAVSIPSNAEVSGLSPGSSSLSFSPSSLQKSNFSLDIGTAGNISLVLQTWLPIGLKVGGGIMVRGGTEVRHSPTIDYLARVFLPLLQKYGARVDLSILKRGYYPEGGGLVQVTVEPAHLIPLNITSEGIESGIISCSSNLPDHVAERQAFSARKRLEECLGINPPVNLDRRTGLSTGSSCTTWCGTKGGTALGRRGYPAERVGTEAADMLINEVRAGGQVDMHLADQLLIYLALYGGSYTTGSLSLHAQTMHWLLGEFGFDVKIHTNKVVEFEA
ncbi:MAG: RNA 3'-terminal phosphate cyclase [Methanomicrobiales archaeon]|nr:RNA 3'-terminal phosphate cyclase [Methanomicrobiales archaeon]